ncbi:hypothetical protein AAVH_27144 [Aphelenchoides avenae]|nr:hypothetical protein AAVH_27144 [Aphelenchus avenae]
MLHASTAGNEVVLNRDGASSCSCIHPCDLSPTDEPPPNLSATPQSLIIADPSAPKPYDFFAAMEHCWARRKRCREEKEMEALRKQAASKLVKYEPAPANHFTRLAGYVDDASERYNQLVSPAAHPLRHESIAPELGQRDLELFGSEPAPADAEHPRRRTHRYAGSGGSTSRTRPSTPWALVMMALAQLIRTILRLMLPAR